MAGIAGKFSKSFMNAFRGISYLFKSQLNARIELVITVLVLISGFCFRIKTVEWLTILLCIGLVLSLESINTALEIFADKLHPGYNAEIGKAKDVAAGSVLLAAIVAAVIGFIIFVPHIVDLF